MDIHFGRIQEKKGRTTICSINGNKQSEEISTSLYEEDARNLYGKWTVNVINDKRKVIMEEKHKWYWW
ncbi:MAG: hypothetical protein ACLTAI_08035 [Thomasclavelia sp.]